MVGPFLVTVSLVCLLYAPKFLSRPLAHPPNDSWPLASAPRDWIPSINQFLWPETCSLLAGIPKTIKTGLWGE